MFFNLLISTLLQRTLAKTNIQNLNFMEFFGASKIGKIGFDLGKR